MKSVERIPLNRIQRMEFVQNPKLLKLDEIMALKQWDRPPNIGINGIYYNGDHTTAGHAKSDGVILATEPWQIWGYGWNDGSDLNIIRIPAGGEKAGAYKNYISCFPLLTPTEGINAPFEVGPDLRGNRGWTALAVAGSDLILWSTSDKDHGIPLQTLRQELYNMGAETAMALDGGRSVKKRGAGVVIEDLRRPVVQNYILIWLKPKEPPKKLYRVQVGAFGVKSNAERLRAELAGKGYPGFIV